MAEWVGPLFQKHVPLQGATTQLEGVTWRVSHNHIVPKKIWNRLPSNIWRVWGFAMCSGFPNELNRQLMGCSFKNKKLKNLPWRCALIQDQLWIGRPLTCAIFILGRLRWSPRDFFFWGLWVKILLVNPCQICFYCTVEMFSFAMVYDMNGLIQRSSS